MGYKFNLFTGNFDIDNEGDSGTPTIPQLTVDPAAPDPESAWVLKSGGGGGLYKATLGLGFPMLTPDSGPITYELSYRTLQGTTVRTPLT